MKHKFIVIDTNIIEFEKYSFEVSTQIKQWVILPFTDDVYRCIMFDGHLVHLIKDDNYIIGRIG